MYKIMKKKCIKSDFKEIVLKLATNDQFESDKMFLLGIKKNIPKRLLVPALGLYTCKKIMKKIYKIRLQRDFVLNL